MSNQQILMKFLEKMYIMYSVFFVIYQNQLMKRQAFQSMQFQILKLEEEF